MSKKLLHKYTFDASAKTLSIDGIYGHDRFLMITNVTENQVIYIFNQAPFGLASYSIDTVNEKTNITFVFDTTSMSDTDELQIFVEADSQGFMPDATFTDPVSKFRVSQPENLIDTDFEYGLQSTKWETLELVKNIPTFFSRNGDSTLNATAMTTTAGSSQVTVTTATPHNLVQGNPIIVQGSTLNTANGGFVVTKVIDSLSFEYTSKATAVTGVSIFDTYTQIFLGSVYQGTEFKLANLNGITTSGADPSVLTVSTEYPLGFAVGTSFFLTNSVGQKIVNFNAAATTYNNFTNIGQSRVLGSLTGETNCWQMATTMPVAYRPLASETKWFVGGSGAQSTISVNVAAGVETITFNDGPHGFTDGEMVVYMAGFGNTVIGGLTDMKNYWVRVLSPTSFYLTTVSATSTVRVDITNAGVSADQIRSCFVRAYQPVQVYPGAADEKIRFQTTIPLIATNPQQAMIAVSSGVGNLSLTTTSAQLNSYTTASAQVFYAKNVVVTTGQTTTQFTPSPAGSTIDQTSLTVTGAIVLVEPDPYVDTLWFPAHGCSQGDVVYFESTSATVPITRSQYFSVTPVGPNRLKFRTYNTTTNFDIVAIGDPASTISISGFTYVNGADVISAPGHGLSNGDVVVYTDQGGTNIGALTNGLTYYVAQGTTDTLQLATTVSGLETPNLTTIANATTGVAATGYVSTNYLSITYNAHGFATGDRVQYYSSTPIGGLRNNGFYYVRAATANTFELFRTANGAVTNLLTDRIQMSQPLTGSSQFRRVTLVDFTSAGTGTQRLTANVDGASDGVYNISNIVNDTTFQLASNAQIPTRTIQFDPASSVSIEQSAVRIPDHYFRTGYEVVATTVGTLPGGLTAGNTYYIIRVSRNWIRFATTLDNAENGIYITLTSEGSDIATLSTPNIIGEVLGQGTVSLAFESFVVQGLNTNFTSFFKTGDQISIYKPETYDQKSVNAVNTTLYQLDTSVNHGWSTGDMVVLGAEVAPTGTTRGHFYYIVAVDLNTVSLYPTRADAIAGTNIVVITDAGTAVTLKKLTSIGSTIPNRVTSVLSPSKILLTTHATEELSNLEYSVGTSLLIRSDGFALHRPYDGGVELIPSSNPDSQMIRQTRKYFRYQSGKGIQVSFAINFSPTTSIERIETTGTSAATIYTKFPHRLTVGLPLTISGAPTINGVQYFNGVHNVTSIQDDYSFRVTLSTYPDTSVSTGGFAEYFVNNWSNSSLRCGLFDDQNGMFFEYDGQKLYVCRRNSTQQISGQVTAQFGKGVVTGINTKFQSQLAVGQYVVLRGQTHLITKIQDDTTMYIAPSYRGANASNIVATKTNVTRVAQEDWDDPCDGTGPSGYVLDLHKIQMAYMDYSWYGAGKVRFGFKDQRGDVRYVHSLIHNNKQTEAYLRSGNLPARYDIQNVGTPTYVPALAHWGTSVIMDGGYNDDKAYVFNAAGSTIQITGANTLTVTGRVIYRNDIYYGNVNNQLRGLNFALVVNQAAAYLGIPNGVPISGAGLQANTVTAPPRDRNSFTQVPYQPSIVSSEGYQPSQLQTRNLLLLDRQPTATAGADSSYTVTLSAATLPVVYDIPLISIRLAPSVDTNTIGYLGEREIINRMQLLLQSVGILTSHACEISLRLNGAIDNASWTRVTNPSLSQLVYHNSRDSISGGTDIYSFRAQGGVGATGRTQISTVESLAAVATLGNSILGGNNTFPDGPDVLTVVARLTEDPSTVSTSNPFNISGRISWSESQA